jgi:hypothetical protein
MTYPPQQPGPGGWDQQPGTNVPSGAPQQQPAWYGNQHTGWEQGQPAQQPPPPPDWGGAEFGQATWTHEPGGFEDVQPPKKSKTGLIVGIVAAVVVVLGGGALGAYFLFFSGPGDPGQAATQAVSKVNQHDFAGLQGELCQANSAKLHTEIATLQTYQNYNLHVGKVAATGNQASAEVSGTYTANGALQSTDQQMVLTVEGGQWKVCQLGQ